MKTSHDDEYLRTVLASNQEAHCHPTARQLYGPIVRSLIRPQSQGFAQTFLRSIRDVTIQTPGGLYLGTAKGVKVDLERLGRIIGKIVCGLFFHEYQRKLRRTHDVVSFFVNPIRQHVSQSEFEKWINEVRSLMIGCTERSIGHNREFVYRRNLAPRSANRGIWGLTFYGRLHFVAFTVPARELATSRDVIHEV